MSGNLRLMVDSCVWVDAYCADHAGCEDARAFLSQAAGAGVQLLFAVHAAKDVLYVLEHEFKRMARQAGTLDEGTARAAKATALGCLRAMQGVATAVGADQSDLWLADRYLALHNDFEDNLVLAACRRSGADFLVTDDRALLAHADVAAKTPRQMADVLQLP